MSAPAEAKGDGIEARARRMFEEANKGASSAPWERQWEPTRAYWRNMAAAAMNTPQPAGGAAAAPYLWLRMKPDGTPDWAEDCVGQDKHFLPSELESEGYWLKPLYDTTPPAAQVQQPEQYAEGPTWMHNGQRISLVNGQLVITRNGKIEFIGAAHPAAGDKVRVDAPMIERAAKVLSDRCADACGVDREDEWAFSGSGHRDDARAALTTALAQQPAACPKCDGTGEADSGGIHPWGAPATIPCDCQQPAMLNGVEGYVTVPKTLTTDMLEAGEQELAMGNDFADAWEAAIDTMLGVPSFTPPPAPAAVAGGDAEEDAYVIDALAHLLAEISIIVNGPEPAGTKWSYHDLPEKVRALKTAPAAVPAGEVVAYLDIGVGGYLDLGTEKDADELFKLPPGRHMLGIIGTYGVDGYKANPPAAEAPAPVQAAPQPADGEAGAALYGMFRALVDAGGATTVARHGAMPRPEKLMDALTRGMLAIERMFHPERFELDEFPSTAALRPSAGEGKGISASHKKHDGPCWRNSHADCGC